MRISDWSSDVCSSDLVLLQPFQEADDLHFKRGVERSRGLVGDEQVRLGHQGHGNGDALAHAARELVRIGREPRRGVRDRSEEHTSELQSLMRISYAVFCLKKKKEKEATEYTTDRE